MNRYVVAVLLACGLWMAFPGAGTQPLPFPIPSPTPGPVVPDSPVPGRGLHVLIIEKRNQRNQLSHEKPGQFNTMFSAIVADAVVRKGGAGTPLHMYDVDQDVRHKEEWVQKAMKVKADSYPWFVLDHNGKGEMGPVPDTPQKFVDIINKY